MTKQVNDRIKEVPSENLGEGYRIVRDTGKLSPMIEWVDWIPLSEAEDDFEVEVHFEDDTEEVFKKGVKLQQIWHEDVKDDSTADIKKEDSKIKESATSKRSDLEEIKKMYPSKLIIALIDNIEKYEDINDLHALKSMSMLSLWLYALGNKERALYYADIVSKMDLTQYKNIKGFSDSAACAHSYQGSALVLCAVICEETGEKAESEQYWGQYLVARLDTNKWGEPYDGKKTRNRWKRNLEKGDLVELYISKKQSYIDSDNVNRVVYESCSLLEELLWMKQAGGSELYPPERLTQLIDEQIKYLTDNIEKVKHKDFV